MGVADVVDDIGYLLSDRHWLVLLNTSVFVFSSGQVCMALNFIMRIFGQETTKESEQDSEDEMLASWVAMAALGLLCGFVGLMGAYAAQKVSIDLLVGYYAAAVGLLAPILLFTFSSFEYQRVNCHLKRANFVESCKLECTIVVPWLSLASNNRCSKPGSGTGGQLFN